MEQACGGMDVPGARRMKVDENAGIAKSLHKILSLGMENRATSATAVHEHSSRSHLMLTMSILRFRRRDSTNAVFDPDKSFASYDSEYLRNSDSWKMTKSGKLNFVDLAGSERVKKSEVSGDRLREAQNINKSLSALSDVIWAFERKLAHVPYRNSKLTHLLQDSLGGSDTKSIMLITLSPCASYVKESLNSLQFGSRLNSVNLSMAMTSRGKVMMESIEQSRLKSQISDAKSELQKLQSEHVTTIERLRGVRLEAEVREKTLREDVVRKERESREKDALIAQLRQELAYAREKKTDHSVSTTSYTADLPRFGTGNSTVEVEAQKSVITTRKTSSDSPTKNESQYYRSSPIPARFAKKTENAPSRPVAQREGVRPYDEATRSFPSHSTSSACHPGANLSVTARFTPFLRSSGGSAQRMENSSPLAAPETHRSVGLPITTPAQHTSREAQSTEEEMQTARAVLE